MPETQPEAGGPVLEPVFGSLPKAVTGADESIQPRILVYSTLFPHPGRPGVGLFIRERMFRVAKHLPLVVVSPQPWFPLQSLLRRWRPHFRPPVPRRELQDGIEVHYPRFFSVPGRLKSLDGWLMALGSYTTLRRLRRRFGFNLIDAHFVYPDGFAATRLGAWLRVPVTITMRGTEVPHARRPALRRHLCRALRSASRVFAVASSLRRLAVDLGVEEQRIRVIGNGVDTQRFHALPKAEARASLGLPETAQVLVSVGALVERKGFHRVIGCLPRLRERYPSLRLLIVGGPSPEGDWSGQLRHLARQLGVEDMVRFLGPLPPDQLKLPLSAADVFVLATGNEGWANVFLEAMACGLPVVTTDVGGNAEVVCRPELGSVVPFDDAPALAQALEDALARDWDHQAIVAYAERNAWDTRVQVLVDELSRLVEQHARGAQSAPG
jgi:teichuronic acid biosynthesis glycosyltransferase TuaC